jgi:hypothetical protein
MEEEKVISTDFFEAESLRSPIRLRDEHLEHLRGTSKVREKAKAVHHSYVPQFTTVTSKKLSPEEVKKILDEVSNPR